MANVIKSPIINPVHWVKVSPTEIPQYISRHMDDYFHRNTIRDFESQVREFVQPWGLDDSIRNQFVSNFGPLTLEVWTCEGEKVYEAQFATMQQDYFNPGYYIRQSELDLAIFEPGYYYLKIKELDWICDPLSFGLDTENTVYWEYSHSSGYYEDVIFGSPFSPAIRVPGILRYKETASKDTIYADQNQAETILQSVPYRIWQFILAGQGGCPPWLVDKISRIFGCDDLKGDGRLYTKAEGATWETVTLDNYPKLGASIDMREKLNRSSLIYEEEVQINGVAAMMAVTDTKGFGELDNGNDFVEILDIE